MPESPIDTIPMFDVPEAAPRPAPRRQGDNPKPVWSKYRPKNPVRCDDCVAVLVEAKGKAPASLSARWKRKAGGTDRLLCVPHANKQRELDALPPLKGGAK